MFIGGYVLEPILDYYQSIIVIDDNSLYGNFI